VISYEIVGHGLTVPPLAQRVDALRTSGKTLRIRSHVHPYCHRELVYPRSRPKIAPIPRMIREEAQFTNQYRMDWVGYGPYTKTNDLRTSYSKLANTSRELHDKSVVIASVLFAIIVVGVIAQFCFWGRHRYDMNALFVIARGTDLSWSCRYPRQNVPAEDKMKTEDSEYLDTVEEPRSGMLRHTYVLPCTRLMSYRWLDVFHFGLPRCHYPRCCLMRKNISSC
jgi:hypothetical protein